MSINRAAGQGEKKCTWRDGARVATHGGDFCRIIAVELEVWYRSEQLGEFHVFSGPRVMGTCSRERRVVVRRRFLKGSCCRATSCRRPCRVGRLCGWGKLDPNLVQGFDRMSGRRHLLSGSTAAQ